MTDRLVKLFVKDRGNVHDSTVRQRYGLLSGSVGICLNLLLSIGKFLAGLLTGSIAVMADAFNNLSDAGSSAVTLIGFRMAGKRADEGHPFGHGRAEYLAGLAVAAVIALVGIELGKSSIRQILSPEPVFFSWLTVGILSVSIVVKLWMSAFNRTLSRRIQSPAMAATAADSLSDAAATAVVLLGCLAGHFFSLSVDGWLGVLVALFILRAGWTAARDTIDPLLGQSPDPELVRGIRDTVLSYPEVAGIHDLIVHDYGPGRRLATLHAEVPGDGDLVALHDIIDAAERALKQKYHLEVSIHMDPIVTGDEEVGHTRDQVTQIVKGLDSGMSIHDFRMTNGPHHRNLIFDVVVPYRFPLTDEGVKAAIQGAITAINPKYFAVIEIDRTYGGEI